MPLPPDLAGDVGDGDEALERMRANAEVTWSGGHYPTIAERLRPASEVLAEAAGAAAGQYLIDIGCGSGNTSVALATRGAKVIGIDQTDAWFADAQAMAAEARVVFELRKADAEDLPFSDEVFDGAVSCFAHMFAPRHDVVAAEMARVTRPGGTIAVAVWDKAGEPAFDAMKKFLPSPPDGVGTPTTWGDEDYLRTRFAGAGVDITTVTSHDMVWNFTSRDDLMDWLFTASGPWIAMRDNLVAAGTWPEAEAELAAAIDRHDAEPDGSCNHHMRYLVAVGRRSAPA